MTDPARTLLRHTLATIAYRGGKAVRGASDSFAHFRAGPTTRTPGQILAHVGDLFDWGVHLSAGERVWRDSEPLPWCDEIARFHTTLGRFDAALAGDAPLGFPAEQLFQGPIADALTHVGQLAMLRRMYGEAVRGENYFKAEIVVGRTGAEQAPARKEFD
ncbi:MAG: hypothetical protein HYR75_07795 [Gemmatimonadetes bacterium]|nr:hypothetical protein [Gemmatimonadota bacterium]MBI3504439.1 hypothetical protein [Pseudomonadota bacterium]